TRLLPCLPGRIERLADPVDCLEDAHRERFRWHRMGPAWTDSGSQRIFMPGCAGACPHIHWNACQTSMQLFWSVHFFFALKSDRTDSGVNPLGIQKTANAAAFPREHR